MGRNKVHEDRLKYIDEWQKANQDKILLRLPKGEKARLQAFTGVLNTSMNSFIRSAINTYMSSIYDDSDNYTKAAIDNAVNALHEPPDTDQ